MQILVHVHRNQKDYLGRGAQDVHLDFHTAPELCAELVRVFSVALRPQRSYGLLRTSTSSFHTAPGISPCLSSSNVALCPQRPSGLLGLMLFKVSEHAV